MEILVLTILSVFSFIGVLFSVSYLLDKPKTGATNTDIKLILYIPHDSQYKLEGLIRLMFCENIPGKCMSDGRVYLIVPDKSEETDKIIESLQNIYPLVVLPENSPYCMITEKSLNLDYHNR